MRAPPEALYWRFTTNTGYNRRVVPIGRTR
jgi:hypothetical protein